MDNSKLNKVLVIVGPTGSGKTALSLMLAKEFKGEIVSADSRQIYRGMDIGTAKAEPELRIMNQESRKNKKAAVKHHLVDIRNPDRDYSVGQYKKDAIKTINKIVKKGRLPIIVGGTGLYVSALVDNLEIPAVKESKRLRKKLEKEITEKGLKSLFDRLVELDPEAAYIVDPDNPRRVIRALEIAIATGKPFSEQRKKGKPLFDFLQIGINLAPDILKLRIENRIEEMFRSGLVKEVKKLVKKYGEKKKAFDAIGYREVIQHLRGEITLEECKELMIKNTWHYAKRQMTWFNKDKTIKWLDDVREAEPLVLNFL
jgi:tRNA dimethylallyltransferase